jgi:heme exporter protein C
MSWTWFHKLASPPHFYKLAGRLAPWFGWPAFLLIVVGLYGGLVLAPPDYQQGDAFRIVYVHAPSAWMSMFVYATMAIAAAVGLIWRIKLAHAVASAAAPIGAWFTVAALATGSLWGKPMWGTWWQWDARLTSELILLFLYLGFIALRASIDDRERADRAGAVLALVGVINLPIIHYSVYWWNTLHQGATISLTTAPKMASTMLTAMLLMTFAFWAYTFAIAFSRARAEVIERESSADWVRGLLARHDRKEP